MKLLLSNGQENLHISSLCTKGHLIQSLSTCW